MADRRHTTASTTNTRAPGRRATRQLPPPPAPVQSIDGEADEGSERDSDSKDPALQPYKRPDMPKFKGPTKAEKTARQFRPLSKLTPSVDEQWQVWETLQLQLEREHNERREALLRARELKRRRRGLPRRAVEEEEEDIEMEDDVGDHLQQRRGCASQRRGRLQYVQDEDLDKEEAETEMEQGITSRGAAPPALVTRHVPPRHERRRLVLDKNIDDDLSSSRGSGRGTKRRKQHEGASEDLYTPPGRGSPFRTPSPPRGPNRQLSELNIPRNQFEHASPSTGTGVGPSRPGQPHTLRHGPPPPPPGYRPSHPGSMLPHPAQHRSEIPATFSPPHPRDRSQARGIPAYQARQASAPSSPGLFVSQSPAPAPAPAEESWPYAEVKDEPASDGGRESRLGMPQRYPEARDLEKAYQEALERIKKQEAELEDKDREIERLKEIIRRETLDRDRAQDQYGEE